MKREFFFFFEGLTKETIDLIMEENGKDIQNAKKPFADYDAIKQQLAEANKAIEDFKGMDIDGVKKAAEEWKAKAEQAEKDAAARIADMEFNGVLKDAITAAKGRNVKAIAALLDVDALKQSKNQADDIKTALEALQKDSAYLFGDDSPVPPPYAPGAGSQNMGQTDPFIASLRAAMGLTEKGEK